MKESSRVDLLLYRVPRNVRVYIKADRYPFICIPIADSILHTLQSLFRYPCPDNSGNMHLNNLFLLALGLMSSALAMPIDQGPYRADGGRTDMLTI